MKNLYDYLFHGIKESRVGLYENPGNMDKIVNQHKDILETIREREPEKAFAVMKTHIEFIMDFFNGRRN